MSYLTRLSVTQRLWLAATLVAMIAIVGIGWVLEPKGDAVTVPSFSPDLTIRQIAPQIGTTGFAMAKELHLSRSVDKDTPLAKLGIEQEQLDEVTCISCLTGGVQSSITSLPLCLFSGWCGWYALGVPTAHRIPNERLGIPEPRTSPF